jgi:hypothetical protein
VKEIEAVVKAEVEAEKARYCLQDFLGGFGFAKIFTFFFFINDQVLLKTRIFEFRGNEERTVEFLQLLVYLFF